MLASQDDDTTANDELLTGTGSGGVLTSGYLRERPLIEYLEAEERVAFVLSNRRKGVRRESDDDSAVYTPDGGYRAIAAVTDTRLLFVVGTGDGDEQFEIPYAAIENTKAGRGVLSKHLDIWTTEGVRWRFYVGTGVDTAPVAEYLERAAVVWSRVESQLRRARKRFVDVDEAVDAGDYDRARTATDEARAAIEEAKQTAGDLTTDRGDAVWVRIEAAETRLESNVLKVHRTRGRSRARDAERQWRTEQYNKAYDGYLAARNDYKRALEIAREHEIGTSDHLRERIDEVTQNLDHLSASPLRRAREAHERARAADDPEVTADLLEEALEKHQTALVLDWGTERDRFAGDSNRLRERVSAIVEEIAMTRRTVAVDYRERGETHATNGRHGQAQAAFEEARAQLEAALSIAKELRPDLVADLEADIDARTADVERAEARVAESGFRFVGDEHADD